MIEGVVIKSTGSWYLVKSAEGVIYQSRIIGKFRLNGFKLTNPVAVGDRVMLMVEKSGEDLHATIQKILPRKNYVVRQSPRKKHFLHLMAANIDQAILIVTIVEPQLKLGFIDRFLLMTEPHDIPVIIVFNKQDIYSPEDLHTYKILEQIYQDIGHETMLVSSFMDESLDKLKLKLANKASLVSGQSGVGKSTLINQLIDNADIITADLSYSSGKGQHTTTFAEMYEMDETSSLIDTPGIKTLSFNNYEVMDVMHNFKEFFEYSKNCKFRDCTHREEPSCAVKAAIETGEISGLRYENYLQILSEIEDQNYWERLTDL